MRTTDGQVHDATYLHGMAKDVAIVLLLLVSIQLSASKPGGHLWTSGPTTGPALALEVFVCSALLLRRVRPVLALIVVVASASSVMLLLKGWSPVVMVAVVAVFLVSSTHDRRMALVAGVGAAGCLVCGGALRTGEWISPQSIGILAWAGFAAALGQAIHSHKAYIAATEERARRAEQTREEEAARRVIEERLRIARELHDVVAHHIAVIQVQSGLADHLLTDRPEAAREAIGHVRRSSRTVLDELGGMLDLLRQPDDPITPTTPAPGLAQLDTLIEQFAAAGLRVALQVRGTPVIPAAAVDLVAYRLVQESLTNAHKHGTGSAELSLRFEPSALEIELVNRIAVPVGAFPSGAGSGAGTGGPGPGGSGGPGASGAGPGPRPGHGLAGMGERAHAIGGTVSASGRDDGTWHVTARLPLGSQAAAPDPLCRRRWPS